MKVCFKCKEEKSLNEFYKHPQMKDGHLNKCKVCTRNDVQKNRQNKWTYYSLYDANRDKTFERQLKKKQRIQKRKKLFPEKRHANVLIGNMLRDNKMKRENCYLCGDPKTQAHHPNYSKPDFVVWLCSKCHAALHADERKIETKNSIALSV